MTFVVSFKVYVRVLAFKLRALPPIPDSPSHPQPTSGAL